MFFYRPLFLFVLLFVVACASITDRRQYIRVVTQNPDTEVYYKNKKMGQGQTTVHINRSKSPQITLKQGKKVEPVSLETSYRWGHSFGGNALLGLITGFVGAPVGWLTDYATGAAWQAKEKTNGNRHFDPDKNAKILILPPAGTSRRQSRLLGRRIETWLSQQNVEYSIVPFKESFYMAIGLGFDNESSVISEHSENYTELIHRTKATHLVFSRYDSYAKLINLAFYSPYSERVVKRQTIENVETEKQSTWDWLFEESFEIVPNTIAMGAVSTRYTGSATQGASEDFRYQADAAKRTPFTIISSISLSNVLHYRKRRPWRVYFRFFPDFNLSYNQVEFEKALPTLPDINLDWAFMSIGYGPRLSFILPVGELFWEVTPLIALNYTRLYSNNYDKTHWVGKGGVASQVGIHSWVSNHWNLKFFFKLQTQDLLENRDISAVDPNTKFNGGLGIIQSGISVGYYFHQEKSQIFNWLGLK